MIKSALTCMDISLVKLNSLKHSTENKHSFAKPPIMTKSDFQANVLKTNSGNLPPPTTSLEMDAKRTENQPEQLTFVTHKKKRRRNRNRNRKRIPIGVRDLTTEADDRPSIDSLVSMVSNLSLCDERSYTGMSRASFSRMPFVRPRKKLLVLDINGLLADIVSPPPKEHKADTKISRRAVFRRPECRDFLNFCFERFEVGVWSSRSEKIALKVLDYLMGDMKHKLLFCWDLSRCTATGYRTLENRHKTLVFKELRRIWEKHDDDLPWHRGEYNESNTLLLDDSPYKALLNPEHTAVFPHPYKFGDIGSDSSLGADGDLRVYLEELSAANDVQKFVEQNPFGQRPISENSPSWDFYLKVISTMYSLPNSISSECLAYEKYKKIDFLSFQRT